MGKSAVLSVRLSQEAKDKLAALARSTRRSANFIAAEAITEYVAVNAWQVEETRKAALKADAGGPFVRHEDAVSYPRCPGPRREPRAETEANSLV